MSNLLGQRIGHFRVVDLLGKGGMGEVYVGYDETLERKVALKTIKAERRLDETAKARFLREARVLSQLHHPNICQIFDYIAGDEADVLVLELVKGRTLSKVGKDLTFKQKLDVALQITNVLIAAHEKGIVHRDLKPDNVMIDDAGQVKVLDFGLSRSRIDEDTLQLVSPTAETLPSGLESTPEDERVSGSSGKLTTDGMVMGTLGYMSPEQARGEVATPASDMYSLGLLLQELFTGKPPYDHAGSAHDLLHRAAEGKSLAVEAIDPDVTALIQRLKSLAPASRPSAIDASDRIVQILGRSQRRIRRALAAATILALAATAAAMALLLSRSRGLERELTASLALAQRETATARAVSESLVNMFEVVDPTTLNAGRITVPQLLEHGTRSAEALVDQPATQAALFAALGRAYGKTGYFKEAADTLEKAVVVAERVHGGESEIVADFEFSLGVACSNLGRNVDAERQFQRSLATFRRLDGEDSERVLVATRSLARLYNGAGRSNEAEPLLRHVLQVTESKFGPNYALLPSTLRDLADCLRVQGENDEALGFAERADDLCSEGLDICVEIKYSLALLYSATGKLDKAEALLLEFLEAVKSTLGPTNLRIAKALNALGNIEFDRGNFEKAELRYRESLDMTALILGPDHPDYADELFNIGLVRIRQKRFPEARMYFDQALGIYRVAGGVQNYEYIESLQTIGNWFMEAGDRETGGPYLRAFADAVDSLGDLKTGPHILQLEAVTIHYVMRVDPTRGQELLNRILADKRRLQYGPASEAVTLYNLACLASLEGSRDEAIRLLGEASGKLEFSAKAISADVDLSSLHGDPEFERILAQIAQRQKSGK